ncbi:MAG: type II toxin-antitoxin system VapC family toxin [Acidobacteriota bacterium]
MLDTDTVSYALRGQGQVATHLLSHRPSEIHLSSITLAELRYGAERRRSRKLWGLIDTFIAAVRVLPFDQAVADRFGSVATALADQGTPIGEFDTLIAAHALAVRMTLVTNNTKHFACVTGLKTENWIKHNRKWVAQQADGADNASRRR